MTMRRAEGPWFVGCPEPKKAQKKSTSYSISSTGMKRKSLIEAGAPKPQFVQTQPEKAERETSHALVPEPPITATDPAEKREIPASVPVVQQPANEIPSPVLVPRTFRLPERLIEDLARAGELRAFSWLDREGNIWLPISSKSTVL